MKFDPLGDCLSKLELIQVCGTDASVVAAARVSHADDLSTFTDERDAKLIAYLLKHKHGTPFEHTMLTFRITAPLYVIQELLRHRAGVSVNQQSNRYLTLGEKVPLEFYEPIYRAQAASNRQASGGLLGDIKQRLAHAAYSALLRLSTVTYEYLIGLGVARELARGVLPHCTYASLYVTFNMRSLMHFIGLRDSSDAQWEIGQYARCMATVAAEHFPMTMNAFEDLKRPTIGTQVTV